MGRAAAATTESDAAKAAAENNTVAAAADAAVPPLAGAGAGAASEREAEGGELRLLRRSATVPALGSGSGGAGGGSSVGSSGGSGTGRWLPLLPSLSRSAGPSPPATAPATPAASPERPARRTPSAAFVPLWALGPAKIRASPPSPPPAAAAASVAAPAAAPGASCAATADSTAAEPALRRSHPVSADTAAATPPDDPASPTVLAAPAAGPVARTHLVWHLQRAGWQDVVVVDDAGVQLLQIVSSASSAMPLDLTVHRFSRKGKILFSIRRAAAASSTITLVGTDLAAEVAIARDAAVPGRYAFSVPGIGDYAWTLDRAGEMSLTDLASGKVIAVFRRVQFSLTRIGTFEILPDVGHLIELAIASAYALICSAKRE
nr:hypothetical protein HK105_007521 [Polyrhizophydium stewartii]